MTLAEDELLTTGEAAKLLNRPLGTLYNWRSKGEGPTSFRVGGKVMYRRSALQRWLEAQEMATSRGDSQGNV